jgi:response regulator RpfG family c-di-GMP phosphodiesterase
MTVRLSTGWTPELTDLMEPPFDRNDTMSGSAKIRNSIRVVLIDDFILTLHGLKTFLSKNRHIEIIGIAKTPGEVRAAIETGRPDVVVLEVRVGETSGIDLCKMIRESHPRVGIPFFYLPRQ